MRNHFCRILFILTGLSLLVISGSFPIKAVETVRPEVRALWVDAFRDGAKTPAQIDRLIEDSLEANINTLIVQVRRRGDAYYNRSIEPQTEDPSLPSGFDALQYLIEKARAKKIEVHAWLNTLVAWNNPVPPQDPNHVWNLHGPHAPEETWVSYYRTFKKDDFSWSNDLYSSYYLDPGNPEAVDYTVEVYLHVIKNYDVDGIHLDYARYAGAGWGYNPVSVARYNAQNGTTGLPSPEDPEWAKWRREQTANLVRKIYIKAIALKPQIKISSAVITWGDGPIAGEDWEKSRAYATVFQDWRGWLAEGIIDLAIPMNYFNEWDPVQQLWYNNWIEWEKNHQYGRQIVIGPAIYTQYLEESLEQIRRAQAPSVLGNYAAGVSLYAYGGTHLYSSNDFKEPASSKTLPRQPHVYLPETNNWFFRLLTKDDGYIDPISQVYIPTHPVFPSPAPIPDMPWKSNPANGYLMGTVFDNNGESYDHLQVTVESPPSSNYHGVWVRRVVYTDGSGWYGLAELPSGHYRVLIEKNESTGVVARDVLVQPGRVSEVNFE